MTPTDTSGRKPPGLLHFAASLALLATACSATRRHEVLTFFFEGVPPPGGAAATERDPNVVEDDGPDLLELLRAKNTRVEFLHEPFAQRDCTHCHAMLQGGTVREYRGGLCRSCHIGFLADEPFVHGPAAVDACLECHHPHKSELPALVLRQGAALCIRCHELADLTDGSHHASVMDPEQACTECHDPHGGDDRWFLRTPAEELGDEGR